MNDKRLPVLLLGLGLMAGPLAAQTTTTPATDGPEAGEDRATVPAASDGHRVERVLDFVERASARLGSGADGFGVRIGGIEDGSGLAAGPAWKRSSLAGGHVQLSASAAASITRDYEYEGGVALPAAGDHRVSVNLRGSVSHLAQERFFGPGVSSSRGDDTTFALDRRDARLDATVALAPWFRVAAGGGLSHRRASDGGAPGVPALSARWGAETLPGFGAATTFHVLSASATTDWRDVPQNPRRGGLYRVELERHLDRSHDAYSFTRVNVELEQHLSWWRRQRMVTVRALAVLSRPDEGQAVPFYLQPTLGGSRLLRGFVTDRFRDSNMLALQAEYAWDLWPFLSAVAFYEGGVVAADVHGLSARNLKRDYGLGFRLGSARTVALRTDVALGSGEGTRITMRFGHAF